MIDKVQGSRFKVQGTENWVQGSRFRVQGTEGRVQSERIGSFALCRLHKGFTLLELIVVLFIVVLGFAAVGINLSSGSDSTEQKSVARDMVSALRYARGQALLTHQDTAVTLDLAENSYTVSGRSRVYAIPQTIDVTLVTAQTELTGEGQGNVRFFSDGSSSGGRIKLERAGRAWKIDINWLTGLIELEDTDASE